MNEICLPALRSDDSLGFLAALGMMELLTNVEGLGVALSWQGLGGKAVLHSDFPDAVAVAEVLRLIAVRLHDEGRLVPAHSSLIPPRTSSADRKVRKVAGIEEKNDPMRATPALAADRLRSVAVLEHAGDRASARWMAGLLTMLAVDREGTGLMTPLYAPAGQQVLSQILGHYLCEAAKPMLLQEALVGWRRLPDSGANLDYRDLRDGAWSPRGKPENTAVPGATWLALMAIPLFRQIGNGRRGSAVGWYRDRSAVRPRSLVWPVWSGKRSLAAIEVLIAHPDVLRAAGLDSAQVSRWTGRDTGQRLKALGVDAVCVATRRSLTNGDGPLGPTRVAWP